MDSDVIDVGFLYPVINGKLYVAQRNTEPHKGLYGPVGGKSEEHQPDEVPYIKEFPAKPHIPHSDVFAEIRNKEYGHSSAIREFYEEVFQIKKVPWEEVSNIFKIGSIFDKFNNRSTNCQFYLAMIKERAFNIATRELSTILPVDEINVDSLYPLAKASLTGLKMAFEKKVIKKLIPYEKFRVYEQIPNFSKESIREIMKNRSTSIEGLIF